MQPTHPSTLTRLRWRKLSPRLRAAGISANNESHVSVSNRPRHRKPCCTTTTRYQPALLTSSARSEYQRTYYTKHQYHPRTVSVLSSHHRQCFFVRLAIGSRVQRTVSLFATVTTVIANLLESEYPAPAPTASDKQVPTTPLLVLNLRHYLPQVIFFLSILSTYRLRSSIPFFVKTQQDKAQVQSLSSVSLFSRLLYSLPSPLFVFVLFDLLFRPCFSF